MKKRNKGKIFPSPSPPFSSPPHQDGHFLSVLNSIPAAILALVAVLSLEDREALAYMITRSLQTATGSATAISTSKKQLSSTKSTTADGGGGGGATHRTPLFHCDCFDCYTAYWFRWDSSPNRELIHQAIEAFEEHLAASEQKKDIRGKKREKPSHGKRRRPKSDLSQPELASEMEEPVMVVVDEEIMQPPEEDGVMVERVVETLEGGDLSAAEGRGNDHKGLARKVLPDVMGLLNSRLWKLWNPSV